METKPAVFFTKNSTSLFKGIAILMIVIHNYLHYQQGFFIENESGFNPKNVRDFLQFMIPFRWYESFSGLASFLGHYGVQLFIFFSAYGLSLQTLSVKTNENYPKYLWRRLKKLYFLLFFGIAVFLILNYINNGTLYGFTRTLKETFMLITSAANFRNSTLYSSFSGPFWYFGLMVQLYIIFPLIFKLVKKTNIYLILGVVLLVISVLYYFDRKSDFSVFGNIIGHLPEVILGIYFAQKGITKPNVVLFLVSIVVFVVSQFYGTIFPASFLSITIILLYLVESILPILNDYFKNTLIYIGEISMILFVVNGPLRYHSFFSKIPNELRAERIFLYLIILLIICYFLHRIYKYITIRLKV